MNNLAAHSHITHLYSMQSVHTTYVTQTNSNYTLAKEGCIHVDLCTTCNAKYLHPFPLKISNLFLNMQVTTQELPSKVVKTMRPYQRHLRLEDKQKA